jgi:hypothetical protein
MAPLKTLLACVIGASAFCGIAASPLTQALSPAGGASAPAHVVRAADDQNPPSIWVPWPSPAPTPADDQNPVGN